MRRFAQTGTWRSCAVALGVIIVLTLAVGQALAQLRATARTAPAKPTPVVISFDPFVPTVISPVTTRLVGPTTNPAGLLPPGNTILVGPPVRDPFRPPVRSPFRP